MRQERSIVLVCVTAFLVTAVTVVSVEYMRVHPGYLLRSAPSSSGPDMAKAKESTGRVRHDLQAIRGLVRAENWKDARGRLRVTGADWTALEQSTRLTNRHFVEGMLSLDKSLKLHRQEDSMELIGRMDTLIQLLDAVLGVGAPKGK